MYFSDKDVFTLVIKLCFYDLVIIVSVRMSSDFVTVRTYYSSPFGLWLICNNFVPRKSKLCLYFEFQTCYKYIIFFI